MGIRFYFEKMVEPKSRSSKKVSALKAKPMPNTEKALDNSNNFIDFTFPASFFL